MRACGLCAICLVICALELPALATEPDLEKLKAEARKKEDAGLAQVPTLAGTYKMQQVCRLTYEQGRIGLQSDLPQLVKQGGQYRIAIDGMPEKGLVTFSTAERGQGLAHFSLRYSRWFDARAGQADTTLEWTPNHLSIGRSLQGSGLCLALTQANMTLFPGIGGPNAVLLGVADSGAPGPGPLSIHRGAVDFRTLRRQQASEVETHVRPLLREMHWESLMAADPALAWQVFIDDWRADPQVVDRVKALLPKLDADGFQERETAIKELRATGRDGAVVLCRMDRKGLTAQQATLVDACLEALVTISPAEATGYRRDVQFLIDCLYCEEVGVRESSFRHLKGQTAPRSSTTQTAHGCSAPSRSRPSAPRSSAKPPPPGQPRHRHRARPPRFGGGTTSVPNPEDGLAERRTQPIGARHRNLRRGLLLAS